MNILLLLVTQGVGGIEKRFYNYSKYVLNRTDNNYTVVISNSLLSSLGEIPFCKNNRLVCYGIKWKKKSKIKRYIDYFLLMLVLIRLMNNKYDSAHFITLSSLFFRKLIRSDKKVHSFVNSLSQAQDRICSYSLFKEIMSEDFIIDCLDERIQSVISEKYPMQSQNIVSSPCSFIIDDMDMTKAKKENIISFVGRLEEFKGIQLLIEIIPQILERTNYAIHIFGRGSYSKSIEELIIKNSASGRIKLDYTIEPKDELKKSKIFLSLQKEENYPSQSLLEAMFCENVIIATDVGLTRKVVREDFGILIGDSSSELLDAIKKLTLSDISLKDMGMKARLFAGKNHTVEMFHQYLLSIYS